MLTGARETIRSVSHYGSIFVCSAAGSRMGVVIEKP